ncbi:MAG TPA: IS30 family transposase [Treponemataceae bacterium]|nr:IS30 family transposase [Treponemataceae bacterium]
MGRHKDSIKHVCHGTHFTQRERLLLQAYTTGTLGKRKITNRRILGEIFNKNERTIRRELKRGWIKHDLGDIPFERWEYNAEHAQVNAMYESSGKGPNCKLESDVTLCATVRSFVKGKLYSPYAIIATFNKTGWPSKTHICEKTLYTYIQNGYITGVTEKDLLYQGKRRKPKGRLRHHSCAFNAEHSISQRPSEVAMRNTVGHWEGDSVVGSKGNGSASMFTCTERLSRVEVIRKVKSRKKTEVVNVFNTLENETGSGKFKDMFTTVTFDNGVEFADGSNIAASSLTHGDRFAIYYAHPYRSSERGTNENHNRIIRRFIPKGTDITTISTKKIRWIQDWMNTYPRKTLNGLTPIEKLMELKGHSFTLPPYLEPKEAFI